MKSQKTADDPKTVLSQAAARFACVALSAMIMKITMQEICSVS